MDIYRAVLLMGFLVCKESVRVSASITNDLAAGVCLCVTEPKVPAIADPTNPSSVMSELSNGLCFITNGGVFHIDDVTYYQLRNGDQTAWVDSYYLSIGDKSTCGSNVSQAAFHTPDGTPNSCHVYQGTWQHGEHFVSHGIPCTCDDGAVLCSLTNKHCAHGGIVYPHGSTFTISGHGGSCTCQQGTVACADGVPVGK